MTGYALLGRRDRQSTVLGTSVGASCFVCQNPEDYIDRVCAAPEGGHVGQCVSLVRSAIPGLPHSSEWRQGPIVRGNNLASGAAIAVFDPDGTYGNHTDGRSHAALYMSQDDGGLYVIDQWTGQPGHPRYVRFRGGEGKAVNDGDRFSVVLAGGQSFGTEVTPSNEGDPRDVLARMRANMRNPPPKKAGLLSWIFLAGVVGVGALVIKKELLA